ncbi:hypothetical protein WDU94_008053 [Cyamophila willieti]
MHPPSSTQFNNSILSPYLPHYRNSQLFDSQRLPASVPQAPPTSSSPYDHPPPRKRHHRSPSDSNQRASVLRVGSLPERESPYPPPLHSPHEYYSRAGDTERSNDHLDRSNDSSTLPPFTQSDSVAVESTPSNTSQTSRSSPDWRNKTPQESSPSCTEDLRIKTEPRGGGGDRGSTSAAAGNDSSSSSSVLNNNNNHHDNSHHSEDSWRDRESNPQPPPSKQPPPHQGEHNNDRGTVWNSTNPSAPGFQTNQEISNAHKSAIATTTPTGKKLQCPYCERLYGYETNLRAHIRQRHQGIRAPCPYCTRTFTRNNTVRRHIAREHKNELNLTAKAYQLSQVQNHNQ